MIFYFAENLLKKNLSYLNDTEAVNTDTASKLSRCAINYFFMENKVK